MKPPAYLINVARPGSRQPALVAAPEARRTSAPIDVTVEEPPAMPAAVGHGVGADLPHRRRNAALRDNVTEILRDTGRPWREANLRNQVGDSNSA